jgi:hypothetical protein
VAPQSRTLPGRPPGAGGQRSVAAQLSGARSQGDKSRSKPWRGRAATGLAIAAGAALLRVIAGVGFANYDTLYALVWGQQLTRGEAPQYWIPIAPTPHPLFEALGVLLAPLGAHAVSQLIVALGFLALAACGWAVYRLGALWFNRPAGAIAALLLVTRVPILSYGVRAYVDVPYLLLVLGALIVETRRPRAGAPVLVLLALAGLLRPEAWAFSGVYWLYLALPLTRVRVCVRARTHTHVPPPTQNNIARHPPLRGSQLAWLALLAGAAPLAWLASDWLVSGDALWSLTNTRHTAETLHRETGIAKVPEWVPRRIGEVLGPYALAVAALGGLLALLWLRERARTGVLAGVAAVTVFAAFASVGLPIDTRYAFLAGAILCIFAGAAVGGWRELPRGGRRRRRWMLAAAVAAVALLASIPSQYRVNHRELNELARQQRIQNELIALVRTGAITTRCEPIGVANHAPIPLLALWLKAPPSAMANLQTQTITYGSYLDPANEEVRKHYILDQNDPHRAVAVPSGFRQTARNRSWLIYEHCGDVAKSGKG